VAGAEKKARKERRTVVFVDESGLSERPPVTRTWAPMGETPQLTFHFNWGKLAVIAGVTWWQFYFRLYRGSIRAPQVVDFLSSAMVSRFIEATRGRLVIARLPAYAPELNPTEYVWGHLKRHALANFCPTDWLHLSTEARRALRRAQRRPTLVRAFWKQAELALF
jgi:hypothetical protein